MYKKRMYGGEIAEEREKGQYVYRKCMNGGEIKEARQRKR